MKFFESHAHFYFDDYDSDREALLEALFASDIEGIVTVGVDIQSNGQSIALAEEYPRMYAACGFHPNELEKLHIDEVTSLRTLIQHDKVVAIGETGIDLYRNRALLDIQRKFFVRQLETALEENVPVIIHSRSSENEIMSVINEVSDKYSGVVHCYAGSIAMAHTLIEKGFYISFTGSITYKNNDREAVVKEIPLEHMLLETDSPFLTPVPNRGKRNDPSNLKYIAEKIALIKGVTVEEVARVTTENSNKLFKIK